jgi:hypothetical protein
MTRMIQRTCARHRQMLYCTKVAEVGQQVERKVDLFHTSICSARLDRMLARIAAASGLEASLVVALAGA